MLKSIYFHIKGSKIGKRAAVPSSKKCVSKTVKIRFCYYNRTIQPSYPTIDFKVISHHCVVGLLNFGDHKLNMSMNFFRPENEMLVILKKYFVQFLLSCYIIILLTCTTYVRFSQGVCISTKNLRDAVVQSMFTRIES